LAGTVVALALIPEAIAFSLIAGSTPAIRENAMASGIRARATTVPARRSRRGLASHCWRSDG
ncbi:MAG: hypothetical protein EON88_27505, partial [Brevundimonas sp.]